MSLLRTPSITATFRMLGARISRTWYAQPAEARPIPLAIECFLRAASGIYLAGLKVHQKKMRRDLRELPVKVVSVGNLAAGGTGKTPFTLWLALYLRDLGWSPAILSRGYGRKDTDGDGRRVVLDNTPDLWVQRYGDEPVLLARRAGDVPVRVGKDRWKSGKEAMKQGADLVVLDDGFQYLALDRHLDFVLLDSRKPLGNGRLLPWGPLREPPDHLTRADALVLTRAGREFGREQAREMLARAFPSKPVFSCRYHLGSFRVGFHRECVPKEVLQREPVIAFAGIARPDSFSESLEEAGIRPLCFLSYPDHHPYRKSDLEAILQTAQRKKASFVLTTEKDWVRIPQEFQQVVLAAALEIDFGHDLSKIQAFIRDRLSPPVP